MMNARNFRLFFMLSAPLLLSRRFEFHARLPLAHHGDCALLGVTPALEIYAEEIYGDDGWMAQRALRLDGTVIAQMDEQAGQAPLSLPPHLARPAAPYHTLALNFSGPRWRGLCATDRINETVYPLPLAARLALIQRLGLALPPLLLLGLAESRVLAETALTPADWLVCRRVRLAYRLSQPRHDDGGLPYDYDTLTLHLIHTWTPDSASDELLPDSAFAVLPGAALRRPLDCLAAHGHLLVADGGAPGHSAAVYVWRALPAGEHEA